MNEIFEFPLKIIRALSNRVFLYSVAILLQAFILIVAIVRFGNYFIYFYIFNVFISIFVVIGIINGKSNPAYKIAWIIPILLLPIFGGLIYLMFGKYKTSKRMQRKMKKINVEMKYFLKQDKEVIQRIKNQSTIASNQSHYIQKYALCPVYQKTSSKYFPSGEEKFEQLIAELKKAKRYIFIEYFIIEEGFMWNKILDILEEKVKAGVEVRVIYDDVGCFFKLPYGYDKKLEAKGIKCLIFNPFLPVLSLRHNNRDHRKIVVIDGNTAFTGGINIADEYINEVKRFGHWKDTAIMIKGEAVWNFTIFFLSLWEYLSGGSEDFALYKPLKHECEHIQSDGFVQPFADSPIDDELVSEIIYLNLISQAEKYIYINTPYLILDNELTMALTMAAKRGVDIKIITPHIPDKWYVHEVSRSNYTTLLECGIHVYEYTPGFNHAKSFVVDDQFAVIGTVNLDYRSLYLHFECGIWMYDTSSVIKIKEDFIDTLEKSKAISLSWCRSIKWYKRFRNAILRIFAPLM